MKDDLHNKANNINQYSQNETLPKTVRNTQKQGNALSSNQIYQGVRRIVLDHKFWDDFEQYLNKSYRKSSIRCRLLYAKQYYHVIAEENARDLLGLPHNKRLQIMKSLAILSKYLGCYDKWKSIT